MDVTDTAIKLKEAGFSFEQIVIIVLLGVFTAVIWFVLRNNTNAVKDMAEGIKTLIYQNKNKYLDDEETEKHIDRVFCEHTNKKWIGMCDFMDENGFSCEARRKQVKEQLALLFDTITSQEREELDEYLTAWGSKLGTKFFTMYMQIKNVYLSKVYEIIFSDNKRTVKKREFYNLCQSELIKIKSKLRK